MRILFLVNYLYPLHKRAFKKIVQKFSKSSIPSYVYSYLLLHNRRHYLRQSISISNLQVRYLPNHTLTMPTYAVLGATGLTGRSLLSLLLADPKNNNKVHAYVRSKRKLISLFPNIEENKSVRIFSGPLDDIPLLASCVSPDDVDVVFCVLGRNESVPGMRIAQDAAQSLVAALCYGSPSLVVTSEGKGEGRKRKFPKIIFLSSASLNPRMTANEKAFLVWVVKRSFSYAYTDLALAEAYLRLHESWLDVTFVTPGALVEDEQKGYVLSLDQAKNFLSYPDLAAGLIEIAESGDYEWMQVGVSSTGKDVKFEYVYFPGRCFPYSVEIEGPRLFRASDILGDTAIGSRE